MVLLGSLGSTADFPALKGRQRANLGTKLRLTPQATRNKSTEKHVSLVKPWLDNCEPDPVA
jgi:hypothetical protein